MASRKLTYLIVLRVLLLAISIFSLFWLSENYDLFFTYFLLGFLIVIQISELIYFTNTTNRELRKFLEAVEHKDYAVSFNTRGLGGSFKDLHDSFTKLIEELKSIRAEKESHAELFALILENIDLGLIAVKEDGTISLMNAAAQNMLAIPHFPNWEMFRAKKPDFAKYLGDFDFEGRKLMEIQSNGSQSEFYLDLTHISLLGEHYYLISFSDLKNEIEQKEIDAWHKLIRILSHEVMNSVTPVTSLSETIKTMLTDAKGNPLPAEEVNEERIGDTLEALDTIIRRSRGMLTFVDDYRKLTKLPAPSFELTSIEELFKTVCDLMKVTCQKRGVELIAEMPHSRMALKVDIKMIEQVLINLIGNSLNALEDREGGTIKISSSLNDDTLSLKVEDNGPGIPQDIMPSIFIPFFSTRKNGTGIGLTLSQNIMKLHRGSIHVQSHEGEGTVFRLVFRQ